MKRSLTLFLASLMLVFALTACGSKNNANQNDGQNGNQNETVLDGQTGEKHDSGAAVGGSLAEDAGDLVNDGLGSVENAVDDLTGSTSRSAHRG